MTRSDNTEVPDYLGKLRLDGRNFVVLGAGQGIGRQATHALASAGARTFCVDIDPRLAEDIASAPRHAAYGAAKAGLMALVRSGAVELGPAGIRVNAVAPGVVWTPRVSGYLGEEGRERNAQNAPLRRVALPADI